MALDITVPAAGQTLAGSRDPIRNNFVSINNQFELDHYAFNSTNNGLHKKVTLPVQAAAPAAGANQMLVYTQTSALSAQPEMVIAKQAGSTAPVAAQINEFTYAIYGTTGETTLPSGIKLKWGRISTVGGLVTFTFAGVGLNNFNAIYAVQATCASSVDPGAPQNQTYVHVDAFSTTSVTLRSIRSGLSGGTLQAAAVHWFAIGI